MCRGGYGYGTHVTKTSEFCAHTRFFQQSGVEIDYRGSTNKQTNKQTNKRTNKPTNQPNTRIKTHTHAPESPQTRCNTLSTRPIAGGKPLQCGCLFGVRGVARQGMKKAYSGHQNIKYTLKVNETKSSTMFSTVTRTHPDTSTDLA